MSNAPRPENVPSTSLGPYRDYANEPEDESFVAARKAGVHPEQNFPMKLHYMLHDMECDGLDHIVSWQPHGRSFVVHRQEDFVKNVLPLWFRQSKYSSFQRQLNLYGFKRITTGRDKGAHYHEMFLRGKQHLAHRIPRTKVKGHGGRKPACPADEPDFYQDYPYLPASPRGRVPATTECMTPPCISPPTPTMSSSSEKPTAATETRAKFVDESVDTVAARLANHLRVIHAARSLPGIASQWMLPTHPTPTQVPPGLQLLLTAHHHQQQQQQRQQIALAQRLVAELNRTSMTTTSIPLESAGALLRLSHDKESLSSQV